jgi:PAS domain S-box-containing protein
MKLQSRAKRPVQYQPPNPPLLGAWLTAATVFLGVGLCYAAGAESSWGLFGAGDIGLAFFPPAGVTLAAMVLLRKRFWPAVLAAVVFAEITVDLRHGLSLTAALGWALANSVEPLVGASLLRRFQRSPLPLSHRRGMFRFLVAGVLGGPLAGAVVVGAIRAAKSNGSWISAAVHFLAGDGIGALAIAAPVLVCWGIRPWSLSRRLVEFVAVEFAVFVVSVLVFWVWSTPPTFLMLPVLVLVAIRYATPGVTVASALMAVVANFATANGRGPFLSYDFAPQNQLAFVQLFIASVMVTAWYLAIETADRTASSAAETYERAARERAEATKAIGELSESLLLPVDVVEIAAVMRAQVGPRYGLSLCAITLVNRETGKFAPMNIGVSQQVFDFISEWTVDTDLPGPLAALTGQPVWLDSQTDLLDRFPAMSGLVRVENLHALGALPLRGSDQILGYFGVARTEDRPFTVAEQSELFAIARVASQAVQRAEIHERERRGRFDLEVAKTKVDELLHQSVLESEQLRESENRFRSMSDGAPLLIWITDKHGRFEWANTTFCEYFDLSVEALVRGEFQSPFHPDELGPMREKYKAALVNKESFSGEWRVWARGKWRWVEMWGKPRVDPANLFCGYIGNSVDVTERKAGDEMLQLIVALQQLGLHLGDVFGGATNDVEIREAATNALRVHLQEFRVQWLALGATEDAALVFEGGLENPPASLRTARGSTSDAAPAWRVPLIDADDAQALEHVRLGRTLSVADALNDEGLTNKSIAIAAELGVGAYVIEPVRINSHIAAVLVVESVLPHQWTDLELLAVKETAKRSGAALEAHDLVLAAAKLRQAEHEAVLTLQHALLPDTIRWNPSAVVHAKYQAASNLMEVGGDWYDTFAWPTGHIGLMVGDVVGHNIASAATMGRLRAAASALAGEMGPNPALILDALDRFAHGPDGTDFSTAVCVVLDPTSGRLSYASAGHLPGIVVAPDGMVSRLFEAQSPPLGATLNLSRIDTAVHLEPGSLVLLYSDGLIERRGEPLDVGISRLERLLADNRAMSVSALSEFIVASLTAHTPPTDDIVIACFRYTPAAAKLNLRIEAKTDQLAGARDSVRSWLATRQITSDSVDDLILVVNEACSNSIDHAYQNRPAGPIDVEVVDHTQHLAVRVTDQGTWRARGANDANRGRGNMIMEALADRFELRHDRKGTAVSCTITLHSSQGGAR